MKKHYEPPRLLQLLIQDVPKKALRPKDARPPRGAQRSSPRRRREVPHDDAPTESESGPEWGPWEPCRVHGAASAPLAVGVPTPPPKTFDPHNRLGKGKNGSGLTRMYHGYLRVKAGPNRDKMAHRVWFERALGRPLRHDEEVEHLCKNRSCWPPTDFHLCLMDAALHHPDSIRGRHRRKSPKPPHPQGPRK